jgi:hypothetical protein
VGEEMRFLQSEEKERMQTNNLPLLENILPDKEKKLAERKQTALAEAA